MDKRRLLLLTPILAALLLLQGCASSGSNNGPQRGFDDVRIDTEIQYEANRALVGLPKISAQSHIIVSVYNRVVLLTGQTPKVQWRQRAVKTVEGIRRVRTVYNEIEIAAPASLPRLSQDAYITSSIKTALLHSDDVPGNSVTVITENGAVYLMGSVTPLQANAAADLARRISGVKKVVLLFEEHR